MKVDFSNKPDSATHYFEGDEYRYFRWVRNISKTSYEYISETGRAREDSWGIHAMSEKTFSSYILDVKEIPVAEPTRAEELHAQLQRMIDEEPSEAFNTKAGDKWFEWDRDYLYVSDNIKYRAKVYKELHVPWDWLDDSVSYVQVRSDGTVITNTMERIPLRLDLEGVKLPVLVNRPKDSK